MMTACNATTLPTLASLPTSALANQAVLVRVDYNVPLSDALEITDATRIRETLPTLQHLLQAGAKIILISHLGRPNGQVVESLRLKPIATCLQGLLPNTKVHYVPQVVGPAVQEALATLQAGEILLLENIRFEAGEEANDPALAKTLASYASVYVNDAFGAAHRAHASTEGVVHQVAHAVAGLLMAKEVEHLQGILSNPQRPLVALVGGSKVSSKIGVLQQLLEKVDVLLIGGGMSYTFLLAQGYSVGNSLVEPNHVETAKAIMAKAQERGIPLVLSEDFLVVDAFSATANQQTVAATAIPDGWEGVDMGPKSRAVFTEYLLKAKSILWNGPVGVFEMAPFAEGTKAMAEAVAQATANGAQSVLGGGDTVAAIERFGIAPSLFTHVSTGGGASLELIEGRELPGLKALQSKALAPSC